MPVGAQPASLAVAEREYTTSTGIESSRGEKEIGLWSCNLRSGRGSSFRRRGWELVAGRRGARIPAQDRNSDKRHT